MATTKTVRAAPERSEQPRRHNPRRTALSAGNVVSVATVIAVGVAVAALMTEQGGRLIGAASVVIRINFGWLYAIGVTASLVFLIWLAFGRYGLIRLGHQTEPRARGWYAFLLTGTPMGVMLLIAGVAEPLTNYLEPPRSDVTAGSVQAAEQAMSQSIFHFGLHAWAIFCLPTLAIAYFVHRRGLPPRVSSVLHPLLGERIHGPIGRCVDVLALTAAVLGSAALLVSGASVLGGSSRELPGLSALHQVAEGQLVPLVTVAVATLALVVILRIVAARSWRLRPYAGPGTSRIVAVAICALLLFALFTGGLSFLANGIAESTGGYLDDLVSLSFWTDAFASSGWLSGGTVLHWTWLITIAPYVGIAVARVSARFTIRGLVLGMLVPPTAFSIVWFGVFGLSAIDSARRNGATDAPGTSLAPAEGSDALFAFLSEQPGWPVTATMSVLLLVLLLGSVLFRASTAFAAACPAWPSRPETGGATWAVIIAAATLGLGTARSGAIGVQDVLVVLGFPLLLLGFLSMYALAVALRTDRTEVTTNRDAKAAR